MADISARHHLSRPQAQPFAHASWRDVLGGSVAGMLTIGFSLSYAALVFSGPLTPWLAFGLAATFMSCAAIAAVLALGSSVPFAIGGIDSATAAVAAILAASVSAKLLEGQPDIDLLAPVILTLSSATLVTGLALCVFGLSGIGRVIRYVPYPVIGGFLGAAGCLILAGAANVVSGQTNIAAVLAKLDWRTTAQLLAALAVGLAINLTLLRTKSAFVLPVIMGAALAVSHAGFAAMGLTMAEVQATGWTFASPPKSSLVIPWHAANVAAFPWHIVPSLAGDIFAVVFVTMMTTLFNTAGLEVQSGREAVLERELTATGLANIASAAFGGYSGCISFSRSTLNRNCGAASALSGLVTAAICAVMLSVDPAFIGYVPKFVLGGLLVHLAIDQIGRWIVGARRRLSLTEYLSLLAIVIIILKWGFIAGVLIGIVIGCAAFAFSASRIDSIKFGFNGTEYRSSLDRSRAEIAMLETNGGEVQGLKLQSYLFFGSANRLYTHVKVLLAQHPNCRFLLFDFGLVTGIDSSAAHSFSQIKNAAAERKVTLVTVGMNAQLEAAMRGSEFLDHALLMPDLDRALEYCENEIIARHRNDEDEASDLKGWFTDMLGSAKLADDLIAHCTRIEVSAGDVIARAGDAADGMHFILEGRVNIMVASGGDRATRVRSLGRHTTIGEMGLVTKQPRSATIEADDAGVLYALSASDFEAIKTDHPALSHRLLTAIISVMAERLAFANRTIGVLRR